MQVRSRLFWSYLTIGRRILHNGSFVEKAHVRDGTCTGATTLVASLDHFRRAAGLCGFGEPNYRGFLIVNKVPNHSFQFALQLKQEGRMLIPICNYSGQEEEFDREKDRLALGARILFRIQWSPRYGPVAVSSSRIASSLVSEWVNVRFPEFGNTPASLDSPVSGSTQRARTVAAVILPMSIDTDPRVLR